MVMMMMMLDCDMNFDPNRQINYQIDIAAQSIKVALVRRNNGEITQDKIYKRLLISQKTINPLPPTMNTASARRRL